MSNIDGKVILFSRRMKKEFSVLDFLKATYLEWDEKIKLKALDSFRRLLKKGVFVKVNETKYCRNDVTISTYKPSEYDNARKK